MHAIFRFLTGSRCQEVPGMDFQTCQCVDGLVPDEENPVTRLIPRCVDRRIDNNEEEEEEEIDGPLRPVQPPEDEDDDYVYYDLVDGEEGGDVVR